MPGPLDAFQLLNTLVNGLLDQIGPLIVEKFLEAADLLPGELPRRAEFTQADEGQVLTATRAAVTRAGLQTVVEHYLAGFAQALERFGLDPQFELSAGDLDALHRMVLNSTRTVTELGGRIDADVHRALALAVRKPLTSIELADSIRGALKAEGQYARTTIETEAKAAQRMLALNVAKTNGFERFMYLGPDDIFEREFCFRMNLKAYTLEMLEACDNDTGMDAVVTLGGYNCRHSLAPATEGMIRRIFPGRLVIDWEPETVEVGKSGEITVVKALALE
jgi:hypothetical protein